MKRYFVFGIISEAPNGTLVASTIDYQCEEMFTHKKAIEVISASPRYSGHSKFTLVGISEMNKKDFDTFVSEQQE